MTPENIARLEQRIQTAIPLAHAAGVRLASGPENTIVARAPLAANGNPHGSVFGGSLYVTALVAGYAQIVLLVEQAAIDATVVISHAEAEYHRPLYSDIVARPEPVDDKRQARFIKTLHRHGRSRLQLTITVTGDRIRVFDLHARFAAIAA